MQKLSLIFLIVFYSFTSFAQQVDIDQLGNGDIKISGRGFVKEGRTYFNVEVSINYQIVHSMQTKRSEPNIGSFQTIISNYDLSHGDEVNVSVKGYLNNGSDDITTAIYEDKDRLPTELIIQSAQKQADVVALIIANTYGQRENFKNNLVNSFWSSFNLYKNPAKSTEARTRFNSAKATGKTKGAKDGRLKGNIIGSSNADSAGKVQALSRFENAIDGGALNLKIGKIVIPNFNGVSPQVTSIDVNAMIRDLEKKFKSRVNRSWHYSTYSLGVDSEFTLRRVYSYNGKYTLVQSWFRDDYAFDAWLDEELPGDQTLYNLLSSDDQKRLYEKKFKQEYEKLIDAYYFARKFQPNPAAVSLGKNYGKSLGLDVSFNEGWNSGYVLSYNASSIVGFNESYKSAYSNGFAIERNYLQSHSLLADAKISLHGQFLPEGRVSITIDKLANYGSLDARDIRINSIKAADITVKASSLIFDLEGLTSLKEKKLFKNIFTINSNVKPDSRHVVTVEIEGLSTPVTTSFIVEWNTILKSFAELSESDRLFSQTKNYIAQRIRDEWKEAITDGQTKNWYENGRADGQATLLKKLIDAYKSSNSAGRNNFELLASEKIEGETLCEMTDGYTWVVSRSRQAMAWTFKELFQSIDKDCEVAWYRFW